MFQGFLVTVIFLVAVTLIIPAASNMDNQPRLDMDSIIADQLQAEIDELRKGMAELTAKLQSATSKDLVSKLQEELDDLKYKLENSYKNIDNLSKGLQQKFREEFNTIQDNMTKVRGELTNRVKELEDRVERMAIDGVIGSIMDGQIFTAAKTFRSVSEPEFVLPRIVNEAYNKDVKKCQNILRFISELHNVSLKPVSLDALFNEVQGNHHIYSDPAGSDCLFKLASQVRELEEVIRQGKPLGYLWSVRRRLPLAVHLFNTFYGFIYITKDEKQCKFGSDNEEREYRYAGHLGNFNKWQVKALFDQDKGEYYRLEDRSSHEILEADGGGRVYLGSPYTGGDIQKWKPRLKSDGQIYLQHKGTGKYLSATTIKSCFKYSLSDAPTTPFWIHL